MRVIILKNKLDQERAERNEAPEHYEGHFFATRSQCLAFIEGVTIGENGDPIYDIYDRYDREYRCYTITYTRAGQRFDTHFKTKLERSAVMKGLKFANKFPGARAYLTPEDSPITPEDILITDPEALS